jgi:hypothetical protein
MSEFGVTKIKYHSDNTHIEQFLVHPIQSPGKLGQGNWRNRQTVVRAITQDRDTVVTYPSNGNGSVRRGAQVKVITVQGKPYLRTDNNHTACDNLENLPTV